MKKIPVRAPILSAVVAMLVVFALATPPRAVLAESASSLPVAQRFKGGVDMMIESMLAAGDYVEGEAIVCYLSDFGDGLTAQESSPLAGAERLSKVTSRQYAEATGEAILASEVGALTAQSADGPVEIALVRSNGPTADLLRELLSDPRVLSAEPNYVMTFAADEGDEPPMA